MSDLDISRLQSRAYAKGYAAGVRDAREAVAPLHTPGKGSLAGLCIKADALAAIDALRGESNG